MYEELVFLSFTRTLNLVPDLVSLVVISCKSSPSIDVSSGDFLSASNYIFMNINAFSPTTTKNIAMNFHGMVFELF